MVRESVDGPGVRETIDLRPCMTHHTEIYHIYHTHNLVLNETCLVYIETLQYTNVSFMYLQLAAYFEIIPLSHINNVSNNYYYYQY